MSRQRSMETISVSEFVTVGELVRLTGVRYSTLKYYTEEGLLLFEQAEENLTRRYRRTEAIERLGLIQRLKSSGMTIVEIQRQLSAQKIKRLKRRDDSPAALEEGDAISEPRSA